jgi:DNA-binding CsgD family transcriptional regulator
MTRNDSRSHIRPSAARVFNSNHKLNEFEADSLSEARRRAFSEVGAAMAHQLNEPLTALMLYLCEMKREGEQSTETGTISSSMRGMVEKALHETERVCDIMELIGNRFGAPVDREIAVASGREIITWWKRSNTANSDGHAEVSHSYRHRLTPRERQVLVQITEGSSNKEGGHRLGISTRTFETHRAQIMRKLGARNAADLVRLARDDIR